MKFSMGLYLGANWGAVALYLVAALAGAGGILFQSAPLERAGSRLAVAGVALHTLAIAYWWCEVGHGPYLAPHEVLGSDAWIVMACFLAFARLYPRVKPAALFAFPAAFVLQALSLSYHPDVRAIPATFRSAWLALHVGLYKIALGTLVIGLSFAVFYLLKAHSGRQWLKRLPPLETLDVYSHRFAGFAFIFWTIGMLAGSFWAHQSWGRFWGWDPTETWSLITCLMFGAYLHLRRFFHWSGSRAAWFYLACVLVSLISLFGMVTLSGSLHADYFK